MGRENLVKYRGDVFGIARKLIRLNVFMLCSLLHRIVIVVILRKKEGRKEGNKEITNKHERSVEWYTFIQQPGGNTFRAY